MEWFIEYNQHVQEWLNTVVPRTAAVNFMVYGAILGVFFLWVLTEYGLTQLIHKLWDKVVKKDICGFVGIGYCLASIGLIFLFIYLSVNSGAMVVRWHEKRTIASDPFLTEQKNQIVEHQKKYVEDCKKYTWMRDDEFYQFGGFVIGKIEEYKRHTNKEN